MGSTNTQPVTLTNTGNATLNITTIEASGSSFTVTGLAAPLTLAPSETVGFSVAFTPQAVGNATGSLTLTSNAVNSPSTLALSGNGIAPPPGQLSVNPTSVNFGDVVVSKSSTQAVTLTNTGGSVVTLTQATVTGAGFSTSGLTVPLAISPGQSTSFNVQFGPASPGAVTGSLSIVSDATNSPTTVSLSGNGLASVLQLSLSPTSVNFGDVAVGSTSTQSVVMTNAGNVDLTVTAANVTGAGFSITPPLVLPLTLTPGQTSSFTARFAPAATGAVVGSMSLVSNATNSPTAVSLAGNGMPPLIGTLTTNPTSINFGDVIVGNSSTQTVVLTNTGTVDLTISAANVTGAGFSITPPLGLPLTLTPGQIGSFTARFAPTSAGAVAGSVSLVSNASNSPTSVALSGTGVAQILTVSLSPSPIDFGDVTVGSTANQTVTMANTGNFNVNVTAATATGAGFSVVGFVSQTLTPGQSATFTARFAPAVTGAAAGTVSLTSTATNDPTVSLSGNGTPTPLGTLTTNPTSINFGSIIVGNTASQSVTLTNTGTANLTISAANVTGAGFSITPPLGLPLTLTPGQTSGFTVQFAPASAGAVAGSVSLVSNASNSPTSVALSGTGVAQILTVSLSPSTINFGDVTVGSTANQTVTMANTGNFNVNVTAATATGAGFSVVGFVSQTLTPGQSATFTARFAPAVAGAAAGTLSLTSTATNNPTVALSGNGTPTLVGTLSTNPTNIDFGSIIAGNTASQSVTLTNTGTANLAISAANVTGAGFSITPPLGLPLTLTPGQTSGFTVQFAPASAGAVAGSVSLVSNASNSPTAVSLAGTGVAQVLQLGVTPTSINFGDVAVGSTSTQSVVMTNAGNVDLTVTAANVTGAGFSITPPLVLPLTLTPGQSTAFTARFAPTVTGAVAGSVSLVSNATNSPTAVSLAGNGVPPLIGTLTTNPTSVNLGSIIVGNTASQSVTMTNTGTADLTVTAANVTGAGFSITPPLGLPLTLTPGQTSGFTVQFAPASAGAVAGSVSLVSNASNSPTAVSLAGTGVAQVLQLTENPTSINFGDVVVGATDSRSVTVTNTGNSNVTITSAPVTGAGFSVTGLALPLTLTPNQNSSFSVQFAPAAAGAVAGSVSLASNAPTVLVSLAGNGVAPGLLNVNPSNLNFGSIVVGNSDTRTITLTNTGGVPVDVLSAAPTGTGFSISGFAAQTLAALGGSMSFTAQFAPAAAGAVPGNITINSTAVPPSNVVTLAGTGVAQVLTVSLSPSTINFGNVTVGSTANQTVTMANTGNFNVNVTAATATGAGFSVVGFVSQTLTPGQSATFTARFAPAVAGAAAGTLSLTSTATNNPTVALSGTGTPPPIGTLTTNPTSINFGSIVVGNTASQSVTLTNTGTANLTISAANVTGAGFSITPPLGLPLTLTPGQTGSFTVRFAPASAGAVAGSVSLVSNASNSPTSVALSGTGVAQILTVSLSPSTINFGNVTVGSTANQTVTMANTGNFNVNVTAASATGAGFSVVGFVAQTLTPGQSATFTARFAPAVAGAAAGTISLTSTATNNPTVALSGTGTPPPIGTLTTNPTSINFGSIIVGNTASQSVTLTNTGTANLTISAANVTGAGFSITPPLGLPLTLTPGQTGGFTVRFAPASAGAVAGSVSLVSNASNSPTSVALSGTGVAQILTVSLSPSTINFGNVTVGSTANQTVTMANTGNFNVNVTAATATGAGFSVVGFVAQTLTPGQSATFTARFAPAVAGAAAGTLSLTSTATNNPTVALSGTGTPPPIGTLTTNPTSINFGSIVVGNTASQSVTLTNTGTANLTISAANVTGAGFSITPPLGLPLTLTPGQTGSFTVRFAPASAGAVAGSVSLVSNASNSPTSVALSGTGVAQILTVSLSPSTINFGNVTVGSTANQTVTMANTGNFNVNVTAATATGAGFSVVGFVSQTLTPGQSATFTARFAPAVAGAAAGTLSLTSTATNNPTVSLSGTGTPPPIGTLTTNPTSINFGSIVVGNTASQSVTLTNTGTANLTISAANVTGAGFSITPPLVLPLTLTPGQTGSFTARFAPVSAGAVAGSVSLVSTASNSPTSVALSGTGVAQVLQLGVNPTSINFGGVAVGSASTQSVVMTNAGNVNLTVSAANVTGAGFSITPPLGLPLTLTPGQTSSFTVRFAPAVTGAVAGSVSLVSNATNSPTSVTLAGNGVPPPVAQLAINPNGIDFGSVVVGSNLTSSVTLTNIGGGSLTISQANVTGAAFSISGLTLPLTLNAGQSTTFTAKFAPTGAGTVTGSVSIVSDASNSPTTLSLSGTGTVGVKLLWDASTSTVVGYNVYRATVTGGPYVRLSASVIPGTTYTDSTAQAGTTYFYVATAVDADGVESIFSNELKVILP